MPKLTLPVGERDHSRGPIDAPVTLVEYGDFECPYCGQAYGALKEVGEQMGPRLRLVFRHFPLTTSHPHAESAAMAAEAAAAEGKFWPMHDLLFEQQEDLEKEDLLEYARALDLEMGPFEEALATGRYLPRIREDFTSGVRSGVNGTPTFFINGVRHEGLLKAPDLLRAVKEAARAKLAL